MNSEKKLAIVIGAGAGLGKAIAEKFGSRGFVIALVGRSASKLEDIKLNLNQRGIEAHSFVGDASNENSLNQTLGAILDQLGDAEVVLYNAVKMEKKAILSTEWDKIKDALDTNVGGAYNVLRNMVPYCEEKNRGKLFFTGGGFALDGNPDYFTVSIGKAALRNMVQAAAKQLEKTRVHVATVTIDGFIGDKDPKYNPAAIAEEFWKLYDQEPDGYSNEVIL